MPDNADPASDKAGNGAAPDSAAMQKLIDEAVGKALAARLPRVKNTEETIAKLVADAIAKMAPADKADPAAPANGNPADGEAKLTMKTLQEQIASLNKGIEAERKARQEAEQKEIQTRTRSEVQAQFAKHLGADNPHLRPYMNEYLTQFQYKDGQVVRSVKDEYGNESYVTADKAVEDLIKSELKHLLPARNGNLPPVGVGNARGSVYTPPTPVQAKGIGALEMDLIEGLSKDRPELAQAILQQAQAQNGTPQK